jgi:hypothetical protein
MFDSVTVADLLERGLTASLNGQLPSHSVAELASLHNTLDAIQLNASSDERHCFTADSIGHLHTKALYSWLSLGLHEDSHILSFVWNNNAPPRVKLYLWLASRDKLQTRANLPRKASFLMAHTRYAPLARKRRRTSSCTAPLLEISGMSRASRSARTSTASTCTAFLNHAASSLLTSPPSLCFSADTCGRGGTTTSSNKSVPLL